MKMASGQMGGRFLKESKVIRRYRKKERKWRLDQDQESAMLNLRQTTVGSCELDAGGYAH